MLGDVTVIVIDVGYSSVTSFAGPISNTLLSFLLPALDMSDSIFNRMPFASKNKQQYLLQFLRAFVSSVSCFSFKTMYSDLLLASKYSALFRLVDFCK